MLDQAFSAKNFRRIYDLENRRGRNVDRRFFPSLVEASARISAASQRIRDLRRAHAGVTATELRDILEPVYAELRIMRAERDTAVDTELEVIAQEAAAKGFQLDIERKEGPEGKPLYPLVETASAYFVAKHIQYNMSRLYKLKPGDRRAIVRQVKDLISTKFRLYIIRTDISNFYESIDRSVLLKEIDADQLLSLSSKSHIKCVLNRYATISQSAFGIPRGVGISAYLSELYMRSVDEKIKHIEGIAYYARYVDDIVAVFSPDATVDCSQYMGKISSAVATRGLVINQAKTQQGPMSHGSPFKFGYLGYDFTVAGGTCELDLTAAKVARYKARIDTSFSVYLRDKLHDQKGASRQLLARIKFLTGNTKLINSKGHAFTGIYYSNSELTKLGKLTGIDQYLRHKISQIDSPSLQNRLSSHSFRRGFEHRSFSHYSTRAIAKIVRIWSYAS